VRGSKLPKQQIDSAPMTSTRQSLRPIATNTRMRETTRAGYSDDAKDKKARNTYNIATYNVRTLNKCGAITTLIEGCRKHNIGILAIQEHRQIFTDNVLQTKQTTHLDNNNDAWHLILSSATAKGHGGVGFLMQDRIAKSMQPPVKISDRILQINVNSNPRLTIIAVYAPTNCSLDQSEKDRFDAELADALSRIPPHNLVIVLGDFNARIGSDYRTSNPRVIGHYTYHSETNGNGERLIDLCENFHLRPAFTRFKHDPQKLWT